MESDAVILYENPLNPMPDVPVGKHYGAFGIERKYERHSGVDLYCNHGDSVFAIESGKVVEINWFTGPIVNTPWWNNTQCVCIEGDSGVIVYGEVKPSKYIHVGYFVDQDEHIAEIEQVLKKDKGKPLSMLHVMLLKHGFKEADTHEWKLGEEKPEWLLDPTPILIQARMTCIERKLYIVAGI